LAAWKSALTVPQPLPDLTHSPSGRGQEAAAQDGTHPGKVKNKIKIKIKIKSKVKVNAHGGNSPQQ